jgi:hypothetical protein
MASHDDSTPEHDINASRAVVPFTFEGKPIRVVPDQNGQPWFAAPDVCRVLEIVNVTNAIRILDDDEKGLLTVKTLGGDQIVNGISEPGRSPAVTVAHRSSEGRVERAPLESPTSLRAIQPRAAQKCVRCHTEVPQEQSLAVTKICE